MKTTTDYCALAWKELRAQFKQVFVIMLAVVTLGMIAACVRIARCADRRFVQLLHTCMVPDVGAQAAALV